jgi:hypothetical protein
MYKDIARKEIVLTVCGTRVTPFPSFMDILMDISADATDYLSGMNNSDLLLLQLPLMISESFQ